MPEAPFFGPLPEKDLSLDNVLRFCQQNINTFYRHLAVPSMEIAGEVLMQTMLLLPESITTFITQSNFTPNGILHISTQHDNIRLSSAEGVEFDVTGTGTVATIAGTAGHNLQGLAWTSWTPTATGLTKTSGTEVGRYVRIGNTVIVEYSFLFGASSAITGGVLLSTPVTADLTTQIQPVGHAYLNDSGTAVHVGFVALSDANTFTVFRQAVSGANIIRAALSSTAPFTWTTGDFFSFTAVYEANV